MSHNIKKSEILLGLRLVLGWIYFSALWRRVALANKLDPELPNYLGIKFNHFLPNALLIQDLIKFFLEHPDLLWIKLVIFTLIEGIVGAFLIFGFFTRLSGLITALLAFGILLGAGALGTTCLDEWQIGVLGIVGGFILFVGPQSNYSIDNLLLKKGIFTKLIYLPSWVSDKLIIISSIGIFLLTLITNQALHGGLWGKLHNKSLTPEVQIEALKKHKGHLSFDLMRIEGPDVYGSFLFKIIVKNKSGETLYEAQGPNVHKDISYIKNHYIAKIKKAPNALILPLGAKASINLKLSPEILGQTYQLEIIDISNKSWKRKIDI